MFPILDVTASSAFERGKHDLASVQQLLRDETAGLLSICRKPDPAVHEYARIESVASVVMELGRGVMHIAPDVPTRCGYEPVALEAAALIQ